MLAREWIFEGVAVPHEGMTQKLDACMSDSVQCKGPVITMGSFGAISSVQNKTKIHKYRNIMFIPVTHGPREARSAFTIGINMIFQTVFRMLVDFEKQTERLHRDNTERTLEWQVYFLHSGLSTIKTH